ncbi:Cyclic di-GMP phosphodiesterase Gmr [Sphingomonas sp. EC-HK361]|uniref:EAL domain-containing protein n=1 Tax=Sphingomonas sp. EC-HK361 TaxID=2038397 RepID=UPI0012514214|nr:EAL domain-containing protein [Sphingomonas sp. EC-HK361]VVT23011.1 Cyclic di-GMP phosphodiesterase Gmr [Sphingomonas sp. EC-HK361]
MGDTADDNETILGVADALGLCATHDEGLAETHEAHLSEASALWPVALTAIFLAPLCFAAGALTQGRMATAAEIALQGGALVAGGVGIFMVTGRRTRGRWQPHTRIITVALLTALLGIGLSCLIPSVQDLPASPYRLAGMVITFGAVIATAIALHPIRAATLAFALSLAIMVPFTAGMGLAAALALLLVALLTMGVLRVARHDRRKFDREVANRGDAQLAARLVDDFESQGTGWFWQTDRLGNFTYLTEKVAREIAGLGIDPARNRITDIFRVDSELVETERTLTFHFSSRTSFNDYSVRPAFETEADRWWSISGRPIIDDFGRFQGFIGSGSDLTEKRRAEAEITRLALFDSLTGLANRQRMRLSLDQTLQQGATTALFLLDLDRFKAVNDTLGHQTGDSLLKQVAGRLQRAIGDAGLVGRLGGDEFQVVLPREFNPDRLAALANEVIATLSQPYFIDGSSIAIGCSIGIAMAPDHGKDSETLVRNADLALYAAKADGRGVHRFYRDELLEGARSRKRLEDDLRTALQDNQLHLTYQPVVSTRTEKIVGYEALVRWTHPVHGSISPSDFIPVAEECGMIEAIGEWVLRTAVDEAARWPGHVRVAVNVSPIQFANPALPVIVTNALAASGLPAGRLELEITEGVFLNESASSERMFQALKGIGVRLALDDFGTGYSSLGYLKSAPFDKIKIDQSFVRGAIQPGNRNAAIIKAIVTLADTLGMETTAEGVEQQDEIALIRELGCSHIQGFVYGRPAPAATVHEQLAGARGQAAPIGHRVSRAARTKMLRSARIAVGEEMGEVRIRNMSTTGAMIDGVDFPAEAIGVDVQIELLEDQLFPATIRWAKDGKAGLEFARSFDMERLNQVPSRISRRTAA